MRTNMKFATAFAATLALAGAVQAADVEVRCEKRIAPARSRVSVDVRNIAPGTYVAVIASGPTNTAASAKQGTIGDEVQFDFDSNPNDFAAGANVISKTFIQSTQVQVQIVDASNAVVAYGAGSCRVR